MKPELRIVTLQEHHGANKVRLENCYIYRGWYSGQTWTTAYHARHGIRAFSNISDITDDAMFSLNDPVGSPENFKEMVDDHIEYLKSAYGGSLQRAYDCEGGFA